MNFRIMLTALSCSFFFSSCKKFASEAGVESEASCQSKTVRRWVYRGGGPGFNSETRVAVRTSPENEGRVLELLGDCVQVSVICENGAPVRSGKYVKVEHDGREQTGWVSGDQMFVRLPAPCNDGK